MRKKTVKDIKELSGKRVFLTADFNISLSDGRVTNDTRIIETMPTIDFLLKKHAKLIIASHLGRPKGYDKKLSLAPVAKRLQRIAKHPVSLIDKFWEKNSLNKIAKAKNGNITLLENIRFVKGEEDNDSE